MAGRSHADKVTENYIRSANKESGTGPFEPSMPYPSETLPPIRPSLLILTILYFHSLVIALKYICPWWAFLFKTQQHPTLEYSCLKLLSAVGSLSPFSSCLCLNGSSIHCILYLQWGGGLKKLQASPEEIKFIFFINNCLPISKISFHWTILGHLT